MTHDEMIAVIAAHRDGKPIQAAYRSDDNERQWVDCFTPFWDFENNDYRLKPAPREWWINVYENWGIAYDTKEKADIGDGCKRVHRLRCVRVREVLD